jgi:hypothetical protein
MNSPVLKVLVGLAAIMVILASGSVFLRAITAPESPDRTSPRQNEKEDSAGKDGKTPDATRPRVVTTSRPPVLLKGPQKVPPDNPLQPSYRPINKPAFLQLLRQQGKTYHNRVVGKVAGKASKKDWGVRGTAYFEYIYAVESRGKILKNDGTQVVEERTFNDVHENLLVSAYEIGLELPESLDKMFLLLNVFGPKGQAVSLAARTAMRIANNIQLPVPAGWVEQARNAGVFAKVPQLDPSRLESELKLFSQGSDNRLLQGKTVRIVFKDGQGVTEVEGVGCQISERERDTIVRTNFILDHYIMPDRKVEPGSDWAVSGDVFSGFLDPRLNGKISGDVGLMRTPDFIDHKGEVSKRLKIVKGNIEVRKTDGNRDITGQITGLRGVCVMPDKFGVVTVGHLHGYASYKNVSADHLLFAAETTVTPRINVSYECTVE